MKTPTAALNHPPIRLALTALWALNLTIASPGATAQSAAVTPSAPGATPALACAQADDLTPAHLYGLWQLTLWPEGGSASAPASAGALLFERHPEFPGSVRGSVKRTTGGNDLQALVSGDVLDGEFNLDESADGVNIDAVWVGVPQDCGQSIRGTRRPAEGRPASETELDFLLKKAPGWR